MFQDAVAAGGEGLRLLRLTSAIPIEGGVPIIVDGKLIGAIGVSGGTGTQDSQVAAAGAQTGGLPSASADKYSPASPRAQNR